MAHVYQTTEVFGRTDALLRAFQALREANEKLTAAVWAMDSKLPLYLPTCGGDWTDEEQRRQVIRSWTSLYIPKDDLEPVAAGLVCVDEAVADAITAVNRKKADFQEAVKAIRQLDKGTRRRAGDVLQPLLDQISHLKDPAQNHRGERLRESLDTAGLGLVQLKRCYKSIKLLERPLASFSWTWAYSHPHIKKITIEQATALGNALPSAELQQLAQDKLGQLQDQPLAHVKRCAPQLRANVVYRDEETPQREALAISGITACRADVLPRLFWRDKPNEDQIKAPRRLQRSDLRIDYSQPVVEALQLYRYLDYS